MITKLAGAFMLGAAVPSISIYLAGGSARVCLILGFLLALAPLFIFPRRIARLLWAVASSVEDFRSHFSAHAKDADRALGRRKDDDPASASASTPNPIHGDVFSAMRNLGVPKKQASAVIAEVAANKVYAGFDEMFKDAMAVVNMGRKAAA